MENEKEVLFEKKIENEKIKLKILQMEDAEEFFNIINDNKFQRKIKFNIFKKRFFIRVGTRFDTSINFTKR